MITFDVITIFPQLIEAFAKESLLHRAQEKKLIKIKSHDLRDWTKDTHKTVDDKPYGGGLGMVMNIGPIFKAVKALKKRKAKIILFTPRGEKFTQTKAAELLGFDKLILVCGRYEGIDERVAKHIADEKLSIGDYVLMGGEIPAMAVIETVARLIPGVIGKSEFLKQRKRRKGFIEYPQYTRPEVFRKWKVPKVLLSGDHAKIGEWRQKHAKIIEK